MTGPKTDNDIVDPSVQYEGFASIKNHGGDPIQAVKAAFNRVAYNVREDGRTPVLIRVIAHVAPKPIDFESDAPLTGGSCAIDGPCEGCQ